MSLASRSPRHGLLGGEPPHGSLVSVMTTDSQEKVTLDSIRLSGTNLRVVLLKVIPLPLILFFSSSAGGGPEGIAVEG